MTHTHALRLRRLGIDTHQEAVVYMRRDCPVCRSEGFTAQARVTVTAGPRSAIATLGQITTDLLAPGEASLSEAAFRLLAVEEGDLITLAHAPPLDSLGHVRGKILGHRLDDAAMHAIINDITAGRYADVHLSAFITACSGDSLSYDEILALTRAMVDAGKRLDWPGRVVADKHCVGGLPGNRTTPIVVAIAAERGLTIPKTSSRAITSPAGTADTMETMAPVDLDLQAMRRVVEREGGCVVWGGSVDLSPADDILVRIERTLDIDGEGQLVASVLSKKIAAGATHLVVDMPVGPTAKVRSEGAAERLAGLLETVARASGMRIRILRTDGTRPVGRGIGPALEALDVIAVLQNQPGAPDDLRKRAVMIAGSLLELAGAAADGTGVDLAEQTLRSGRAWRKFQAICEAQGGQRVPTRARQTRPVVCAREGRVSGIDNRVLARVARLAGAPAEKAAGLELHVTTGQHVRPGDPLYTIHAEARGELAYALDFVGTHREAITVEAEP